MASNKQAFGGNEKMSFPQARYCPVSNCRYNTHPVKADSTQTKKHLLFHGYTKLLKTSRTLNLIEDFARPKREELIEILANRSLIRSLPNV